MHLVGKVNQNFILVRRVYIVRIYNLIDFLSFNKLIILVDVLIQDYNNFAIRKIRFVKGNEIYLVSYLSSFIKTENYLILFSIGTVEVNIQILDKVNTIKVKIGFFILVHKIYLTSSIPEKGYTITYLSIGDVCV